MKPVIDGILYPDCEPPVDLSDECDAADYLHRVCGAYDFGMPPQPEVVATLRELKPVFDKYPISTSMGYHALRRWFGWEEFSCPVRPFLKCEERDPREGRDLDPALNCI